MSYSLFCTFVEYESFNKRDFMELNEKIVIYQTEDGNTSIDVKLENETVWLTQAQIAMLFGTKRPAITKHLKNIYASGELEEKTHVPFWNIWVTKESKFMARSITTLMLYFLWVIE